ncbi:alpha/beta hydrolase [Streptacidiphilus monticola]|uniref:Alpha/beta hydrolase n=1 Tax=Streptacidiphilus monticola TaxID=2161674 RepID=A0ABW1FVP6_9ACTN
MGLTSRKLELLAAVLALAAVVATVWLWPRLAGRNWRALLGRSVVLLLGQALTLSAVALATNDWGGFYSSWGDLLGTDRGGIEFNAHASAHEPVRILGAKPVPLMLKNVPPGGSGGVVQQVTILGGRTGIVQSAYVYLPPQYFQPGYAHRTFPTVVVLTGYPGSPQNLISRMKVHTVAAQAIYRKQMQPAVLVLTRPSVALPRDTECQDVPGGPQARTFLAQDLRRAIAARYRVGTSARSWGVLGYSTGGYCALALAMRDAGAYTAAASLSGDYAVRTDATTGDLFHGDARLRRQADLLWRLRNLPMPPVSVLVASSHSGEADYRATRAFIAAARPPLNVASLFLPSGGHNFDTWSRELPTALVWTANQLRAGPR